MNPERFKRVDALFSEARSRPADDEPFLQIWRGKVFALLLERGRITETLVHQMLQ